MARVTILVEDREGTVHLEADFDPPINSVDDATNAQFYAVRMLEAAKGTGQCDHGAPLSEPCESCDAEISEEMDLLDYGSDDE